MKVAFNSNNDSKKKIERGYDILEKKSLTVSQCVKMRFLQNKQNKKGNSALRKLLY